MKLDRRLFKQKRAEQMMAVESIIKMEKYEKRYQIINMIFEKILKVNFSFYVLLDLFILSVIFL